MAQTNPPSLEGAHPSPSPERAHPSAAPPLSLEDDELYHPQHPQSIANLPTPDQFPTHSPGTAVAIIYLPRGRGAFVWVHSIDTWVYCHGRNALSGEPR